MDLVERYLQAVRFWLPKAQREDIAAELSEDIRSQIEDRESSLGRKLNESEVAEILKQHGSPMLVANRFRPPQYLIGPTLFPIYIFVLKLFGAFYVLPWILVWIGLRLSRVAVGPFGTTFWPVVIAITLAFALLERAQAKSGFLDKWDPLKLPPLRDPNKIPRSSSIIEMTVNLVFLIWMIAGSWYQTRFHIGGVTIEFAPVWTYVCWGFMLLAMFNIAISVVNVVRPIWTWQRAAVRTVTDCVGSVLLCWLMRSNFLAAINVTNVPAEKTDLFVHAINWWTVKMFPLAVVACVVIVALSGYRVYRVRAGSSRPGVLNTASGLC
jgi:hypothetical protein